MWAVRDCRRWGACTYSVSGAWVRVERVTIAGLRLVGDELHAERCDGQMILRGVEADTATLNTHALCHAFPTAVA